ncbi:11951_t:CDS:2, partial [Racocetra persica]
PSYFDNSGYFSRTKLFSYSNGVYFDRINDATLTFNTTKNPDFEKTKQEAVNAWQTELEKVYVEGGTDELNPIFY